MEIFSEVESKKGQYWKWVPVLEMGMPVPVLANCAFGYLHVHAQCVVHAHAHFTLTTSNKNQSRHAHFSHDMHIFDMHISLSWVLGFLWGTTGDQNCEQICETGFFSFTRAPTMATTL
jgi:hypothetical protein